MRNKFMTLVTLILVLSMMAPSFSISGKNINSAVAEDKQYSPYIPSYKTYDTTYDAILKMYIRVINAYGTKKEGHHDLFNQFILNIGDLQYMSKEEYIKNIKDSAGYYIGNVLGDEEDELIIGCGSCIYEVFTMQDGRVRELVHSGYRVQDDILDTGQLLKYTHYGANYHSYQLYGLTEKGYTRFITGYLDYGWYRFENSKFQNETDIWFRMRNKDDTKGTEETLVQTEQANAWIQQQESKILKFDFIPLSIYELGTDKNIGIISVKGKTTGKSTVNIRKKPSKKARLLVKANVGTFVEILGEDGDYYQIEIDGKTGYVQKDYLTEYSLPNSTN